MEITTRHQIKAHFEFAYPYKDSLLIIGWCSSIEGSNQISITLGAEASELRVLLSDCIRYERADVAAALRKPTQDYGFVATFNIPQPEKLELVGVNLNTLDAEDDNIEFAMLVPDKAAAEQVMRSDWRLWENILQRSSSIKPQHSFEKPQEVYSQKAPAISSVFEGQTNVINDFFSKTSSVDSSLKGKIEFAYPHGDGLLIVGWCSELSKTDNLKIRLGVDEQEKEISLGDCVRLLRQDINETLGNSHQKSTALYGFIASFSLESNPDALELVGVSLVTEAEDDPIDSALLVPEKTNSEKMIKENWNTWHNALEEASHTLSMQAAFEKLQERFNKPTFSRPLSTNAANPLRMYVDSCTKVSNDAVVVAGWAVSIENQSPLSDLNLSLNKSNQQEISFLESAERVPRADVVDALQLRGHRNQAIGFVALVNNLDLSTSNEVIVTAHTPNEQTLEEHCSITDLSSDPFELSEHLFNLFSLQDSNMRKIMSNHIGPALKASWKTYRQQGMLTSKKAHLKRFGPEPKNPKATLIIPLYKRYDFVEYQLSQFALDPFMKNVEIIYVNDDPEIQTDLLASCSANYPIYQLPFKVLHAGKNLGYAGANNLGASIAQSDTMLLLNSDVIPKQTGWLEPMLKAFTSKTAMGALGVRLLYEDNSIQHDGMIYERSNFFQDLWVCEHPLKGLSSSLKPANNSLKEVEAVTGACLMVSKTSFKQVGGLDKNYILGDFEDSDLCLKLRSKGYKSYLMSNIELYHLERQSQNQFNNNDWKLKLTLFNCWQHNERWDTTITNLKGKN